MHSQRVTVRLVTKHQFIAEFPDAAGSSPVVFDEPPPLGDGRAPMAAAVLAAAIGNCLSASLADCLSRARVELETLTAKIVTHVARNDVGRYRVASIDVELIPDVRRAGRDRCDGIFDDYSTITEVVREGIPVNVSIRKLEPQHDDAIIDRP